MARDIFDPREAAARQDMYGKFLAKFDKLSPWKREINPGGSTEISKEKNEKYRIEHLRNPEDKRVEGSHRLLAKIFGKGEVDSLDTIKTAMAGKVVGDEETADIPLIVTTVENNKGEVVGTTHSSILESFDDDFSGTGKSFAIDAYTAVDPEEQNKNLGLEMYRHRIEELVAEAEKQGKPLDSIVAEVHGDAEEFYNKVGLKRLYFKGQDQKMRELPYYQSVLADAWNKKTGQPREGEERVPEHLMIASLDGRNEITAEELLEKIRAMMDYNSFQTEGYFGKNKKAYEAHMNVLENDLLELEKALSGTKDGRIALLSAEERNQMLSYDKDLFIEHTAADEEK
ncbi:MAG: hypothetical protein ABIH38_04125 [Patescibacteria group bacterium]